MSSVRRSEAELIGGELVIGLVSISILLVAVGLAILWKQANAKSCPVHSAIAGRLALFCAAFCLVAGVLVFLTAIVV